MISIINCSICPVDLLTSWIIYVIFENTKIDVSYATIFINNETKKKSKVVQKKSVRKMRRLRHAAATRQKNKKLKLELR